MRKGQPVQGREALRRRIGGSSSPGRSRTAGPDAAIPESNWDIVAQASDESFPCSDPPAWSALRVGKAATAEFTAPSTDAAERQARRGR